MEDLDQRSRHQDPDQDRPIGTKRTRTSRHQDQDRNQNPGLLLGASSSAGSAAPTGPPGKGHLGGSPGSTISELAQVISARIAAHKHYPLLARRRGVEGTVELRFNIQPDGTVDQVEVLKSAGPLLDEAARQAVLEAVPLPAAEDPVRLPISFRLMEP